MLIVWNVKWQPNGYGIPLGVEKLESRRDGIEHCTVHEFFQFRFFLKRKMEEKQDPDNCQKTL